MSQQTLLIVGAGASKSLTSSLPTHKKVGLIGGGLFRELPPGAELINAIINHHDKSLIFILATLLFKYTGYEINDEFFLFTKYIENVNYSFIQAQTDAGEKFYDFKVSNEYENFIKEHILELKNSTKKWLENASVSAAIVIYGTNFRNDQRIGDIITHSQFLKELKNNLSSDFIITRFDWCFIDIFFLRFIYYTIACNDNNFSKIKELFNMPLVLDFILKDWFEKLKIILSEFSGIFSHGFKAVYPASPRFNGTNVINGSIYAVREEELNKKLNKIEKVLVNNEYSKDKLLERFNEFIDHLEVFISKLQTASQLPPLCQSTLMHFLDLGQVSSAKEFDNIFGINIINELKCEHNINGGTVQIASEFADELKSIYKDLQSLQGNEPQGLLNRFNKIMNLFHENGFKLEKNGRMPPLLEKAILLSEELLNYIRYFINPKLFNLTDINDLINRMKSCYLATSIIKHYLPISIDYFMVNIREVAYYEFSDIDNEPEKIKNRIQEIHKYTKFIVANILLGHVSYAYYARDNNNYLRHMIWKFIEDSHFTNQPLGDYILEHVEVINFNYELSFLLMLYDYLPYEVVNEFAKKDSGITQVYGEISIKDTNDRDIFMCEEDAIWNSLFKVDPLKGNKVNTGNYSQQRDVFCNNLLEQISDKIKWIGEDKENEHTRNKFQQSFSNADKIYFLGFGFDLNNLYTLGLINKQYQLENAISSLNGKHKTIYITGGNAKIVGLLKRIFKIESQELIYGVYHLRNTNLDIYVSEKYLPDALVKDL